MLSYTTAHGAELSSAILAAHISAAKYHSWKTCSLANGTEQWCGGKKVPWRAQSSRTQPDLSRNQSGAKNLQYLKAGSMDRFPLTVVLRKGWAVWNCLWNRLRGTHLRAGPMHKAQGLRCRPYTACTRYQQRVATRPSTASPLPTDKSLQCRQLSLLLILWKSLPHISSQHTPGCSHLCELHWGVAVPGRGASASHQ